MVSMKNGYVFYDRLKDSPDPHWKKLYTTALNEFSNIKTVDAGYEIKDVGNRLIEFGNMEQQKEKRLLQEIFGISFLGPISLSDYPKFIKILNETIGLKDQYRNLLVRLTQKQKIKKKDKKSGSGTGAYYFMSYLTTAIRENLESFLSGNRSNNLILNGDYNTWEGEIRKRIEEAINDAVIKMSQQTDTIDGEEVQIWRDAINLLNRTDDILNQFKSDVFKRYNLNNVIKDLYKWKQDELVKDKKNKSTKGLSTKIGKSMGITNNFSQVAGYIQEYIVAGMQSAAKGTSYGGGTLKSNMMKTDNIHLFSLEENIDLQTIFSQLNEELGSSSSLEESRVRLQKFYDNYLKKINDNFIIYENVKNYNLQGKRFGGFSGGSSMPVSILPDALSQMGYRKEAQALVHLLYNTISGAVGESNREDIVQNIRNIAASAVANFLFDDWNLIGKSSNNAIHIFNLDGVMVPLSYMMIAMGQAILDTEKNSTAYFRMKFHFPKEILYKNKIKVKHGESIYNYWDEQRADAEKNTTFTITFLSNFIGTLRSFLSAYN